MMYVLVDPDGVPIADYETRDVFVFRSEYDARQFARPGERIMGWVPDPTGHFGTRKTVPLPDPPRR